MGKTTGLGAGLLVAGYDLSGDIGAVTTARIGRSTLPLTGIDKSAMERGQGAADGEISFMSYFNDADGQEHLILRALPTTNRIVTYCHRKAAIGDAALSMIGKQIGYDPTRGDDGSLTMQTQCLSDGYGGEWGRLLTPGVRTDGGAVNGASLDTLSSQDFGLQAYLHVIAFTGTDATIHIEDSANDSDWLDLTNGAFTEVATLGGAGSSERIQTARDATVRQYLRISTSTSTSFSNLVFAVNVKKNYHELVL
jgi:hypothetical protein